MKCVETYKTREKASEARRQLTERGIEAKILVDSIDGRFGGLSTFDDVGVFVREDKWKAASDILRKDMTRRAS